MTSIFLRFGWLFEVFQFPHVLVLVVIHYTFSPSLSPINESSFRRQHLYFYHRLPFPTLSQSHVTFPNSSQDHFSLLRHQYPGSRLLIVSNTAGSISSPSPSDPALSLAKIVSTNTGVAVLTHSVKKPACGKEIMDYFRNTDEKEGLRNIRADQIAVVGDRLLTDMCLANEMGSWGVWVKDGVVDLKSKSVVSLISSGS